MYYLDANTNLAELEKLDIEAFDNEVNRINEFVNIINLNLSGVELENQLMKYYLKNAMGLPWKGDFDSFMANSNNHLVFE